MHTFILQDYITIRGAAGATVLQNESGWLDLTAYEDLVFWTDVRQVSGTPVTINLQTAPTKDEIMFVNMITGLSISAPTTTSRQDKALLSSATVPVARFVRWTLTSAAVWDITFRIYVAANAVGM